MGHAIEFGRNPLDLLLRGYRQFGEIFEFRMAGQYFVVFAGPEAHDSFFRASESQLNAREVYRFTVPIFGKGVAYDIDSEKMAEQLSFLFPLLREGEMQRYTAIMQQETEQYISKWSKQGIIDLPGMTNELTVNIASRCLLGEEIRERLDLEFAALFHDLQGGINTIGFFAPYLPIPAHQRRDKARKKIFHLVSEILEERRKHNKKADDFMHALMIAKYHDGKKLTDDEITGLLLTVLFAGQHTSSVLAAWTLIELIKHPEYLSRVHDEIFSIYKESSKLTLASLKQQSVLERAIRECERVHPPLIILIRKVKQDFQYGPYLVPAGKLAAVSPLLSHQLPGVFNDPEMWNPDRFTPPRSEEKQYTHTLIGFGGGKHRCMGMHFAYLQIKALLTILLSKFDFELVGHDPVPDYGSWVTGPIRPCNVRYKSRDVL